MENPNKEKDCKNCYWFSNCIKIWDHKKNEVVLEKGCYLMNGNYMINDRKCYRCHYVSQLRGNAIGLFNSDKQTLTILSYIEDEGGIINDKPN